MTTFFVVGHIGLSEVLAVRGINKTIARPLVSAARHCLLTALKHWSVAPPRFGLKLRPPEIAVV